MKATISDVARLAGVSTATVSYVVNGKKKISEQTQHKVRQAIQALNYAPDSTARSFRTGKKHVIAMIVPFLGNDVFITLAEAAEQFFSEYGYHLLISSSGNSADKELNNLKVLCSGSVDGIMISSCCDHTDQLRKIIPQDFPVVFFDRILPGCTYDAVEISDELSAYEAVSYLLKKGHKKIGLIEGFRHLSNVQHRVTGYRSAFQEHHMTDLDSYLFFPADYIENPGEPARRFLEEGCTAMIFATPTLLWKTKSSLEKQGVSLQSVETVVVTDSLRSRFFLKGSSLLQWPLREEGRLAARRLIQQIEEGPHEPEHMILQSTFIPSEQASYELENNWYLNG